MEDSLEFKKFKLEMIQKAIDNDSIDVDETLKIIFGILCLSNRPLTDKEKAWALEVESSIDTNSK